MAAAPPVLIRPGGAGEPPKPEEKPYQPFGAALELFGSKRREVLLSGPAGTGKSRACLEKLNLVAMQRPIRAAIIRKTRKSLTQSAMTTFETKVLPTPNQVRFHEGDQEYRYPSGARIMVAGLDDPEKVGSTEFDLVYVQEATELEEDDWGMLLRGLRNGVLSYQQLIADCNPSSPDHWLKQRCNRGECLLLESKHEDNPTLWQLQQGTWTEFGKEYVAGLDSLQGYLYQRLRLGLWVAAQGMYFTEFDPALHVTKPFDIPDDWPKWLAVDYGFAAPFCCLWLTREPETRRMYVYRELYGAGLRDEQQVHKILEASQDEYLVLRILDPSMFNLRTEQQRPSIASIYWAHGLRPVYPGMNNRKQGWAIVRRALATDDGQPRLQFFEGRCPNLLRTLPTMVVDPLDPEDLADKVGSQKTEDHAVDALRYALAAEAQPPRPTEPINVRFG
jgi:PBSX family phage terminase large subunit